MTSTQSNQDIILHTQSIILTASFSNNLPQYILLKNLKNIFLELMSKQIRMN